jgi:HEPN domain-containing protein
MMATVEQRNYAKSFLKKAEEYLASAEDNLTAERHTPAAGDAIHSGISSKDAVVTALTGSTSKGKAHATAAKELKQALGKRPEAATAEKALRDLLSAKGEVEYGVALVTATKAEPLVRRAQTLLELAVQIVRLGR